MKNVLIRSLSIAGILLACRASLPADGAEVAAASQEQFLAIPSLTNAVRLLLYTNASPDAPHLFNTFTIEAYDETLLQSPAWDKLSLGLAGGTNSAPHNIVVDGRGPDLFATNSMRVIGQSSNPDWSYVALDVSAAYGDRTRQFTRSIVFVAPDLFVVYDHLVAKEPADFQMLLHVPEAAHVDELWHDLRLKLPKAGMTIQAPPFRKHPRNWERIESPVDKILPGTSTMRLAPPSRLGEYDFLTVYAIHRAGEMVELASKLLQSATAIGARIFRNGLPVVVAFNTDPSADKPGVAGFEFTGPVGVAAYKPKNKP